MIEGGGLETSNYHRGNARSIVLYPVRIELVFRTSPKLELISLLSKLGFPLSVYFLCLEMLQHLALHFLNLPIAKTLHLKTDGVVIPKSNILLLRKEFSI